MNCFKMSYGSHVHPHARGGLKRPTGTGAKVRLFIGYFVKKTENLVWFMLF